MLKASPPDERQLDINCRNAINLYAWRVRFDTKHWPPAAPDPRTDEQRDAYNAMMCRRLVSMQTIKGTEFFRVCEFTRHDVRARYEFTRHDVRARYDAAVSRLNARLERGEALGIGDAPGSARVVSIDE